MSKHHRSDEYLDDVINANAIAHSQFVWRNQTDAIHAAASEFSSISLEEDVLRFVPAEQRDDGHDMFVKYGKLMFDYHSNDREALLSCVALTVESIDDMLDSISGEGKPAPRIPNCGIGFSVCSPKDKYDESAALWITEQRMDADCETSRITAHNETIDIDESIAHGVMLIPPRIVYPLYDFIGRIELMLGSNVIWPKWVLKFKNDVQKIESAKKRRIEQAKSVEARRAKSALSDIRKARKASKRKSAQELFALKQMNAEREAMA